MSCHYCDSDLYRIDIEQKNSNQNKQHSHADDHF